MRTGLSWLAFAAIFLCSLLSAHRAFAQRVLLVRPPATDATLSEAFNRLRAELMLQDFEVTVLDVPSEGMSADALEAQTQQSGAFAGISLTRHAGGASAEVRIADRVTGKISQRRLAITDAAQAPRVLAVRAVDLLRSSLRELPAGELPPPDVVGVEPEPPPPQVRKWSAPEPRWQLRAAGSALDGPAKLGTAFGGSIALIFRPVPQLGVGLAFFGPFVGARYTANNGTASVRQELVLARGSWNLLREGAWAFGPALGVGAYHLHAQSEVQAPLVARSADVYSFACSAGLEAEVHVTPALTIGASVGTLLLGPEPVVAIDSSQRALKEPLLLGSLGVGVAF
ncbi:MAG TPA: hypothetical protein VGI10_13300 [Polyangiaceae bacterium]